MKAVCVGELLPSTLLRCLIMYLFDHLVSNALSQHGHKLDETPELNTNHLSKPCRVNRWDTYACVFIKNLVTTSI